MHFDLPPGTIVLAELDVLVELFYLINARMWDTISIDQSIAHKVLVVVKVLTAQITPIGEVTTPICGLGANTLIYPVPNAPALQVIRSPDDVPIFFKIAIGITHGMAVFAHDVRPGFGLVGRITFHVADGRVHGTNHIGVARLPRLFRDHGAGVVALFDPVVGFKKHLTVATFVAQRPHHYTGVVFIALQQAAGTVVVSRFPLGIVGGMFAFGYTKRLKFCAQTMGLNIGFIDDV